MSFPYEDALAAIEAGLRDGQKVILVAEGEKNWFFLIGRRGLCYDEDGNEVVSYDPVPGDLPIVVSKETGEERAPDMHGSIPYELLGVDPTADELEMESAKVIFDLYPEEI